MGQCTSNKSTLIEDITKKKNTSKSKSKHSEKMDKNVKMPATKGQVTRFGFKKPPQVPVQSTLPSIPGAVTKETIEPLIIPAPIKQGVSGVKKKDNPSTNRFGFRSPSAANKISDVKTDIPTGSKLSVLKLSSKKRSASETRFNKTDDKASGSNITGSNSSLNSHENRPTSLYTSVQKSTNPHRFGYTGVDKRAKTIANNKTVALNQTKLANKNNVQALKIQELQNSPSLPRKIRHDNYPSRANHREMIFNAAPGTRFDLRDLIPMQPENKNETVNTVKTEKNQHNNVASKIRETLLLPTTSTMAVQEEFYTEEKQQRDRKTSEKVSIQNDIEDEEFWTGPGEAMAAQDEMIASIISDIDNSPESMNPPLRSVLLNVESGTFATLAASSLSGLLEDEASPESPDISCSSPSSFDPLPPPPANINKTNPGTPETPGSPTRTNSSSSDIKDRDFLIDDEIADQPGLVFDTAMDENSLLDISRSRMARLTTDVSRVLANVDLNSVKEQDISGRHNPNGTLSPCDSLASDDLMLEFDQSDGGSALDESLKNSSWKAEFIEQSDQMYREWNSTINKHPRIQEMIMSSPKKCLRKNRICRVALKSISNENSPLKQPGTSTSPESDDSGIKLDKDTADEMLQCLKTLKNQLLTLQNVLQEEDANEKGSKKNEDILDHHQPEGEALDVRDFRRQLVLLELEREEKNWQLQKLREELRKLKQNDIQIKKPIRVNVATQTERLRPITTAFFQNSPDSSKANFVSFQLGKTFTYE